MACCVIRDSEYNSTCTSPFEGGCHYLPSFHFSRSVLPSSLRLLYPNHSLASGQTTGWEHSSAHQQKIGLKIYGAWAHPSEQELASPPVSLSRQEASTSLLSFSIRRQTGGNHNHRKLAKLITWTTALSNSMKL